MEEKTLRLLAQVLPDLLHGWSPSRDQGDHKCFFCNERSEGWVGDIRHKESCSGIILRDEVNAALPKPEERPSPVINRQRVPHDLQGTVRDEREYQEFKRILRVGLAALVAATRLEEVQSAQGQWKGRGEGQSPIEVALVNLGLTEREAGDIYLETLYVPGRRGNLK